MGLFSRSSSRSDSSADSAPADRRGWHSGDASDKRRATHSPDSNSSGYGGYDEQRANGHAITPDGKKVR